MGFQQRLDPQNGTHYGPQYGHFAGGLFQLQLKEPEFDRLHAEGEINAWDISAIGGGPLTPHLALTVGARVGVMRATLQQLEAHLGPASRWAYGRPPKLPTHWCSKGFDWYCF